MQNKNYSQKCVDFTEKLTYDVIPQKAIDHIKLLNLDWIGCAIKGASTKHAEPAKAQLEEMGGTQQARSIRQKVKSTITNAAFFNGYVGHIMEMDDVDRESISHPATIMFPTALALGEWKNKTGKEYILACVAGYEVMLRVGAAITPGHYAIWHTTATAGAFGSAMAAGKMLGLSNEQLSWALGNAGTMAAGLWQFVQDGAMSKFLHAGRGAANGIEAAYLASKGFTGSGRILEGTQGFFAGFARQDINCAIFNDFFERFRTETVSIKPYPCCRHTQSSIDASAILRQKRSIDDIQSVDLATYKQAISIANTLDPKTPQEAKFSLKYIAAKSLLKGPLVDADFAPDVLFDEETRKLMDKIVTREEPEISALMPEEWPSRMTVTYKDGTREVVQVNSPKGDPGNPVSWDEVVVKFKDMTDSILSADASKTIIDACSGLENLESVTALMDAINKGA